MLKPSTFQQSSPRICARLRHYQKGRLTIASADAAQPRYPQATGITTLSKARAGRRASLVSSYPSIKSWNIRPHLQVYGDLIQTNSGAVYEDKLTGRGDVSNATQFTTHLYGATSAPSCDPPVSWMGWMRSSMRGA
jgi:hypothetical protein